VTRRGTKKKNIYITIASIGVPSRLLFFACHLFHYLFLEPGKDLEKDECLEQDKGLQPNKKLRVQCFASLGIGQIEVYMRKRFNTAELCNLDLFWRADISGKISVIREMD
jgi:hypothetical protein